MTVSFRTQTLWARNFGPRLFLVMYPYDFGPIPHGLNSEQSYNL
jgi:hypothetical protein